MIALQISSMYFPYFGSAGCPFNAFKLPPSSFCKRRPPWASRSLEIHKGFAPGSLRQTVCSVKDGDKRDPSA